MVATAMPAPLLLLGTQAVRYIELCLYGHLFHVNCVVWNIVWLLQLPASAALSGRSAFRAAVPLVFSATPMTVFSHKGELK
jgi:hypothetical protein